MSGSANTLRRTATVEQPEFQLGYMNDKKKNCIGVHERKNNSSSNSPIYIDWYEKSVTQLMYI